MRLLLGGGGTGGHIFPALAVTRALEEHVSEELEVLFVGTATGIEAEIVPDAGFAFEEKRTVELEREEQGGRERPVGDILSLGQKIEYRLDGLGNR